jgi:hypothetical protein
MKRKNVENIADSEGWYLYGITLRETAIALMDDLSASASNKPVQALEQGKLAAVAEPVLLAEFQPEALQEHAQNLAWLEAMVRGHNQMVERIHQKGAVLPVKFGAVYPDREALLAALAERHDDLLAQLQQLGHCDEWGIHLYADRQAIQRLAAEHPTLQRLKDELAAASPGRAYLLKRKLADEMVAITEEALNGLARTSYERLARFAVAGRSNPRSQRATGKAGEQEIFHASFLVQRANLAPFLEEVQRLGEEQEGLRCEYSGPWPPYSFAELPREELP